MRRRLYIPKEVIQAVAEHIKSAVPKAVEGYWSANEDEDVLTGHLGACLKIGKQKVQVTEIQTERLGEWTWSLDYFKFRGRGKNATENILGADGLFELKLNLGNRSEKKSLLFQAKKDWDNDPSLVVQCIKLSTWREAAFILNYTETAFEAFSIDTVLRAQGNKSKSYHNKALADFLGKDFLECLVGDINMSYDPKARKLRWRAMTGEVVATVFDIKHRTG